MKPSLSLAPPQIRSLATALMLVACSKPAPSSAVLASAGPAAAPAASAAPAVLPAAPAALASSPVSQAGVPPGKYFVVEGWDAVLEVKPPANGTTRFSIGASGANGHSCSLEGEIAVGARTARVPTGTGPDDLVCTIAFEPKETGFYVTTSSAECNRYFCGVRAHFDGELYARPTPGCEPDVVEAKRTEFRTLHAKKRDDEARALYEPFVAACAKHVPPLDAAWMRNDLAVSLHALGDDAACLSTLAPLDAWKGGPTPGLPDATLDPVMRATSTNFALCRGKKPAR